MIVVHRDANRGAISHISAMMSRVRARLTRMFRTPTTKPAAVRASMASRLLRLIGRRDPTSRALARALRTTALGRIPEDERGWFAAIESHRRALVADQTDLPAGFEVGQAPAPPWLARLNNGPTPISGLTQLCSVTSLWGLFQMRLVRELAPRSCLELGTALGMSAAYQGAALELNGAGRLITLDGARAWGAAAEQGLSALGLAGRAEVVIGPIDDTLAPVLERIAPVDYAFLDADHTEEATLRHFDMVLPHLSPGALVLLDDIHYSEGMWRAWMAIKQRNRVTLAIDLGRIGVVTVSGDIS